MRQTRLTVAEAFRKHGEEFLQSYDTRLPSYQKRALWSLAHCQTEALGGTVRECSNCGHREYRFNSCRTRGCPQCEGSKEASWLPAREDELLPTHYFHIVFTLPHALNELILHNRRECFSAMFQAVAKTLQTVGQNRLKAKLGFFCILHTWGQKLDFHPHIHCVVPGGGLSTDGKTWIATSKNRRYFAPTKVLGDVFRGILLKRLKRRFRAGKLKSNGNLEELFNLSVQQKWVVHAQPPFGSALQVLKYLSRYTRKVALSNSRLLSLEQGMVAFSFKDHADNCTKKICHLKATEFIRRFLMHIPQPGFVRIRYFGFMAGKNRKARLLELAQLIAGLLPLPAHQHTDDSFKPGHCPVCGMQAFTIVETLPKLTLRRDSS